MHNLLIKKIPGIPLVFGMIHVPALPGKPSTKLGVQILAGCNEEAMAVAQAARYNFIRAEGFVFAHVADEGITNACAGNLLRYRKQIGADSVSVLCDIKKKHSSHSLTQDVSLRATGEAAQFFRADGVIVTGPATGEPADPNEISELKESLKIPVAVGSGVTADNVLNYKSADILIIGSYFKNDGVWTGNLDSTKINNFMKKLHSSK